MKLKLNEVLERLWMHLIIKLLLLAGKDVILVVCDKSLKMTHFVAIIEQMSVEEFARLFRDNI